jgi:HK97 family phage portal protein
MGVFNALARYTANRKYKQYAKVMNGLAPVFSSFGQDVYASDIVENAIRCIATEMGKLNPRHIRTDPTTGIQKEENSDINRLLKYGPNAYMSTSDFLQKITYLREKYKNAYIYPEYEKIPLEEGKYKRRYTAFYPLNPINTELKEAEGTGELWIEFTFSSGYKYQMPYADIIHWRKDYNENDYFGGNADGTTNNKTELRLLQTDDVITQGIDKGIKASLGVTGVLKSATMLDKDKQMEAMDEFEQKLKVSTSGVLFTDIKNEFVPIKMEPRFVDKDTVEFIIKRILANRGVSLPIYMGEFTEEEYQAFYEKTLEHMVISLGRAFSRVLFTDRQLDVGNEVIFYNQGLMFTNMANKIKAVDILSRIGVLTDNQVLGIFGYAPFEGGDIRNKSLNYINRDIADSYQLSKIYNGKEKAKTDGE